MAKRDITGAVDFPYLAGFTGGDDAIAEEVLALFLEQCEVWLRLLDPAPGAAGWRDGAHTMKGAILDRLRYALDLVKADIAAWRHERVLRGAF